MKRILLIAFFSFSVFSCSRNSSSIGSPDNPLVLGLSYPYFENLKGDDFKTLEDMLSSKLGLKVMLKTYINSVDLINDIGAKKVDFAFLTLNEYLISREEFKVKPILQVVRRKNETTFYGVIAKLKLDKKIKTVKDLDGKKIASRSPYSISGFILPSILFAQEKIKPEFVFTDSHEKSLEMLEKKQVDAVCVYKHLVDKNKKVEIIKTIGPVQNEPVVCRNGLKDKLCMRIKDGLVKLSTDTEFSKILNKMADITGFKEVNPVVYKDIHETILNYRKGIYSIIPNGIEIKKISEPYYFD